MALLEEQEFEVETANGDKRTYIISKFPAIEGREIVTQYPITGVPKIGEYKLNKEIMLKLMCYVAVRTEDGGLLQLKTAELVNNHVPDWETLAKLEFKMMEYNCSFFGNGKASDFLSGLIENLQQSIMSTLTGLLQQFSQTNKQP